LSITAACRRAASPALRRRGAAWNSARRFSCDCFSASVERASSSAAAPVAVRVAEGVDADDRVFAGVLLHLVVHRLFLDLAALVAGLHRAEHAAALGDALELLQHRSSTSSVSSSMMNAPWFGFSFFARPPLAVDDQLDRHRAAHALSVGVVIASSNALVCSELQLS
jgi:hypothetical protein